MHDGVIAYRNAASTLGRPPFGCVTVAALSLLPCLCTIGSQATQPEAKAAPRPAVFSIQHLQLFSCQPSRLIAGPSGFMHAQHTLALKMIRPLHGMWSQCAMQMHCHWLGRLPQDGGVDLCKVGLTGRRRLVGGEMAFASSTEHGRKVTTSHQIMIIVMGLLLLSAWDFVLFRRLAPSATFFHRRWQEAKKSK